jgi:CheY-like chemotaxis protein
MSQTVLIIDDNENDILITKRVLSKMGRDIKVKTALSGEAGLELLRNPAPGPDTARSEDAGHGRLRGVAKHTPR